MLSLFSPTTLPLSSSSAEVSTGGGVGVVGNVEGGCFGGSPPPPAPFCEEEKKDVNCFILTDMNLPFIFAGFGCDCDCVSCCSEEDFFADGFCPFGSPSPFSLQCCLLDFDLDFEEDATDDEADDGMTFTSLRFFSLLFWATGDSNEEVAVDAARSAAFSSSLALLDLSSNAAPSPARVFIRSLLPRRVGGGDLLPLGVALLVTRGDGFSSNFDLLADLRDAAASFAALVGRFDPPAMVAYGSRRGVAAGGRGFKRKPLL